MGTRSPSSLALARGLDFVTRRRKAGEGPGLEVEARGTLWVAAFLSFHAHGHMARRCLPEVRCGHVPCFGHWHESRSVTCPFWGKHIVCDLHDDRVVMGYGGPQPASPGQRQARVYLLCPVNDFQKPR